MNRNEELKRLQEELEQTPPQLAFTVTRARARAKTRRTLRLWGVPAASLGGVLCAFVLLVNVSLPFALACVNVPLLKEVMAAVAFSPSIKAMVQNDFIQPVGITKQVDGVSMTIHYLAYDSTEVHIFYTATYNGSDQVEVIPDYSLPDGENLESISFSSGMPPKKGELGHMNLHLYNRQLPPALRMVAGIYPRPERNVEAEVAPAPAPEQGEWQNPDDEVREQPKAVLEFDLKFDEAFIAAKRTYTPHAQIEIDGRTITLETVTVYPTGTQLVFADDPANDAWLKGLDLWLEDGKGRKIERKNNGVISSGGTGEFVPTYWLESNYFEPENGLTLCISGARWLEKEKERIFLDLKNPEKSESTPSVSLYKVVREGKDVKLIFHITGETNLLGNLYVNPEGEEGYTNVWGYIEGSGADPYEEYTYLWDYPWDTVEMRLHYSEATTLDAPVKVPLGEQ